MSFPLPLLPCSPLALEGGAPESGSASAPVLLQLTGSDESRRVAAARNQQQPIVELNVLLQLLSGSYQRYPTAAELQRWMRVAHRVLNPQEESGSCYEAAECVRVESLLQSLCAYCCSRGWVEEDTLRSWAVCMAVEAAPPVADEEEDGDGDESDDDERLERASQQAQWNDEPVEGEVEMEESEEDQQDTVFAHDSDEEDMEE